MTTTTQVGTSVLNNFTDLNKLPILQIGNSGPISFAGHHVIPTAVFNESLFLKALQTAGLWNNNSFAQNGVPLPTNGPNGTAVVEVTQSSGDTLLICLRMNLQEVKEEIFVGGHDHDRFAIARTLSTPLHAAFALARPALVFLVCGSGTTVIRMPSDDSTRIAVSRLGLPSPDSAL